MRLATSLALLAALAAAAFLALAHTHAGPPPEGVELILHADDADGVIEPGQTVKVSAAVRFPGQYGGAERMKASDLSLRSNFDWETAAGGRLNPTLDNNGWIMGVQNLRPTTTTGGWLTYDLGGMNTVLAMDGRTAVTRDRETQRVYIYDTWNKGPDQSLIIPPPAGATNGFGCGERGFTGVGDPDRCYLGRPVAVWHETPSFAWLFIGDAKAPGPGGEVAVGRLHIYSLDWTTDPPTYTLHGSMQPPLAEAGNHLTRTNNAADYSKYWASYGGAVSISADGSTLAVGAGRINQIGAVYVYTRPDSEGDWADIAYEDGVKVTVAPTPHWGQSLATGDAPFSGQACDAICKTQRNNTWNRFAWRHISLSADGRVLAAGAGGTWYYHDIPALAPYPSEGGGAGKSNAGQAYVFVAPDGGWQAAPDVVTGKTVLTAKQAAPADYSRATHITAGPNRRITSPTTILRPRTWASASNKWYFGQFVTVTRDGATIAVSTSGEPNVNDNQGPQRAFIFQVDSPDQWEEIDQPWVHGTNPITGATSAEIGGIAGYGGAGWCGMAFNGAGNRLALGLCGAGGSGDPGEFRYIHRPADGRWVGGGSHQLGTLFVEPTRAEGNSYGMPLYSLNGERLAVSALGIKVIDHGCCRANSNAPGYFFLSDSGCREHRDAEGRTWTTCPIRFPADGEPTIVVPPGQPEGALTVSGQVTLTMYVGDNTGNDNNDCPTCGHGDDTENAKTITSSKPLTLRIGAVEQLADAQLDFAVEQPGVDGGDDRLYPGSLKAGERTVLRLQLLNERGMPAAGDAIASIIATTTRGALSSNIRDAANARISNGCLGGGGDACQIEPTLLTLAGQQARLFTAIRWPGVAGPGPGYSADDILLTLTHNGTDGDAVIDVAVVAKSGQTLSAGRTVTLTGAPHSLSIAQPAAGLLNTDTPDSGADQDDRDTITLAVAVADKNGNRVDAPATGLRARLTGPDGRRVNRGVELEYPLGGADNPALDPNGNRQVRVNVNRAATDKLANGEYTLEVQAGNLSAEQTLTVSGGPASLTLGGIEGTLAPGEQITLTATVLDAEGNPVPNDTPVEWSATDVGIAAVLVQLSAAPGTTDGTASATWLVLSRGSTVVRARAGDQSDLLQLDVAAAMAAAAAQQAEQADPPGPADGLRRRSPGLAAWFGDPPTTAAALLADLQGVDSILLWSGLETGWQRYAIANGQPIPGSTNFQIPNASILWLPE